MLIPYWFVAFSRSFLPSIKFFLYSFLLYLKKNQKKKKKKKIKNNMSSVSVLIYQAARQAEHELHEYHTNKSFMFIISKLALQNSTYPWRIAGVARHLPQFLQVLVSSFPFFLCDLTHNIYPTTRILHVGASLIGLIGALLRHNRTWNRPRLRLSDGR